MKVLYITGLYHKQQYCQEEKLRYMNRVFYKARAEDIDIMVATTVNNSPKSFTKWLTDLHERKARFPWTIKDIGQKDYWMDIKDKVDAIRLDPMTGKTERAEGWNELKEDYYFNLKQYDLYRLMAEVFNDGIDQAIAGGYDYMSILSGDQLPPIGHAAEFVGFLEEHKDAGMVCGLMFFDYSKKRMVVEGKEVTGLRPMLSRRNPDENRWLYDNLLPNEKNGYTGLEYAEIDRCGNGGVMIKRAAFERVRFATEFDGRGEDIRYCDDLKAAGFKLFVKPTVYIPNRYPDGQLY
jgi:hypothetical protein